MSGSATKEQSRMCENTHCLNYQSTWATTFQPSLNVTVTPARNFLLTVGTGICSYPYRQVGYMSASQIQHFYFLIQRDLTHDMFRKFKKKMVLLLFDFSCLHCECMTAISWSGQLSAKIENMSDLPTSLVPLRSLY